VLGYGRAYQAYQRTWRTHVCGIVSKLSFGKSYEQLAQVYFAFLNRDVG
jgi:hypothetical protein